MPGNLILEIAEVFGQPPHEVEEWPIYWVEHAALKLEARNINQKKEFAKMQKGRKK